VLLQLLHLEINPDIKSLMHGMVISYDIIPPACPYIQTDLKKRRQDSSFLRGWLRGGIHSCLT
jgi:hypothetical protein